MFVARSAARIARARAAFVLLVVLPCLGLGAWAVHRRSVAHRDAVRLAWQRQVGLPLTVTAIDHPRPGVIRGRGCVVATTDGRPALTLPVVEVETAATEVRLRIDRLRCDAAGAAVLATVAGDWLERGARFDRNCVIEIADFAWDTQAGSGDDPSPLRIECVVQQGDRAVRIVRPTAAGPDDEVKILRRIDAGAAGDRAPQQTAVRFEIEADCRRPLPFPILVACAAGTPLSGCDAGDEAVVTGVLRTAYDATGWNGEARGTIAQVDLAACTVALAGGAAGEATIAVDALRWSSNRIETGDIACTASRGRIEQRLLDALVGTLGCRPGAAYGLPDGRGRAFDAAACRLWIDHRGAELRVPPDAASALAGGLAAVMGRSIIDPPPGGFPVDRLAWLLAPPGATFVPATGPGAWLMSILPRSGGRIE
jgi:hypothetical protein